MQRVCFQLQVKPDRIAEYTLPPRRRLAGDAQRPGGQRLAQLLAVHARRRPADRLLRNRRPRCRAGGHERHRRQCTLAGTDGRVLHRPRGSARCRLPSTHRGLQPRRLSSPPWRHRIQQEKHHDAHPSDTRAGPTGCPGNRGPVRGPTATPAPASRFSPHRAHRARPQEKIADAAQVHKYTGLAPKVSLHIPWDHVDDFGALRSYAGDLGVGLGTINSNTFQDDAYKFGSLTHTDPAIRRQAVEHHLRCIDIMHQTGSRDLKIWLADGTNYPGPGRHPLAPGLAGRIPGHHLCAAGRGPAHGP